MTTHNPDNDGHQAADASMDLRDYSPPPSLSPTPAISSCPSPDRTFSTVSSLSNFSADATSSSTSTSSKRRGYIRPQGTAFADSAKNRESVMSLGSITHLQYYFARTGLLDGKGAQLARETKKDKKEPQPPKLLLTPQTQLDGGGLSESPLEDGIGLDLSGGWDDGVMLPPTVSTYSVPTYHIPPPPDLESLRNDLQSALEKARQVVSATGEELEAQVRALRATANNAQPGGLPGSDEVPSPSPPTSESSPNESKPVPPSWHEIEGMHILDVVTLAIRAAKVYYTSHEDPERLALIKSDRKIREDLLAVLDVLKRWASRNFAGGLREAERSAILGWISTVSDMVDEERRIEDVDRHKRASWAWTDGDWVGREREREEAFIHCLNTTNNPLPTWTFPTTNNAELPTDFLSRLRDGRDLVRFHNEAVRLSRRHFGEIKSYHQDIGKPYRMAENLRYWVKAAEIRWEIWLDVDVMGVVNGNNDKAWKKFDAALLKWCRGVREELASDWQQKAARRHSGLPPPDGAI